MVRIHSQYDYESQLLTEAEWLQVGTLNCPRMRWFITSSGASQVETETGPQAGRDQRKRQSTLGQ